jgi:hypothetical protein
MGMAVNNIVLVQMWGTCLQQRIILDLYYRVAVASVVTQSVTQELTKLGDFLDGATSGNLTNKYLGCLPNNYTLNEIRCQKIYPVPRSAYIQHPQSLTGLMAEDTNTVNSGAAMTLRTDEGGYGQWATKHIGPIGEADFSDGHLSSSLLSAVQGLAQACVGQLPVPDAPVFQPIVYHKNGDGPSAKYTDVTNWIVNKEIRVQRRRTVGLGI